jgi:hypothetical protein
MNRWFFGIITALILAAIGYSFYNFYIVKNYDFLVEAPCDPQLQSCYIRDCSDGACPPNNLSIYRIFRVKAADFERCSSNSCLNECVNNSIRCIEVECGESEEDICTDLSQ